MALFSPTEALDAQQLMAQYLPVELDSLVFTTTMAFNARIGAVDLSPAIDNTGANPLDLQAYSLTRDAASTMMHLVYLEADPQMLMTGEIAISYGRDSYAYKEVNEYATILWNPITAPQKYLVISDQSFIFPTLRKISSPKLYFYVHRHLIGNGPGTIQNLNIRVQKVTIPIQTPGRTLPYACYNDWGAYSVPASGAPPGPTLIPYHIKERP
jgi:hypothetical protein